MFGLRPVAFVEVSAAGTAAVVFVPSVAAAAAVAAAVVQGFAFAGLAEFVSEHCLGSECLSLS